MILFLVGFALATKKTKRHTDEPQSPISVTAFISPSLNLINGKISEIVLFQGKPRNDRFSFCNETALTNKIVMSVHKVERFERPSGVLQKFTS